MIATIFPNELPTFLSVVFLLAFTFPLFMVAQLAHKADIKNAYIIVLGFYISYLALVSYASFAGFFDTIMLPPKIVLTTTIPLAILLTSLFMTSLCKQANENLSLENLVGVHIFRFIGGFFIVLFLYDLLPPVFALIAGIGDVITACSSIFVVRAIQHKKKYARRLTYIWNTFGFLDILATSAMAIIFTKLSIDNGTQGVEFLVEFPFCFIPAFAPATIIFLHLLVFRKLSSQSIH